MPDRDYSHRDVVDKLGVKPGHAVAVATEGGTIDRALRERILTRAGRPPAVPDEPVDVALVAVDDGIDATAVLARWKPRLDPAGGVWLLSPKRGQAGYIDQRALIAAGQAAGLVDNKSCSVSETTSGMRFVIRNSGPPEGPMMTKRGQLTTLRQRPRTERAVAANPGVPIRANLR